MKMHYFDIRDFNSQFRKTLPAHVKVFKCSPTFFNVQRAEGVKAAEELIEEDNNAKNIHKYDGYTV